MKHNHTRWTFVLVLAFLLSTLLMAAGPLITVGSGLLDTSNAAGDEGGFAIGQATYLVVVPGSPFHARLLELKGKPVELIVRTIE